MSSASHASQEPPRVWVLISDKIGDDSQSLLIARRLGWPFEVKRMVFPQREEWRWYERVFGPNLRHLDRARSDPLEPPWPDLVISAGRRQVPVVRWIKQRSGGRTKLVQFNRPFGISYFDLVLAPPQLRVPARPNVYHLRLSLQRVDDAARLEAAAARWRPLFEARPRPWIAAMLGGPAWPFILDAEAARVMMARLQAYADAQGGSLFVSTSRRTPPDAVAALAAAARDQDYLYRWEADPEGNPYAGFLALAEQFVVTGDSASMITEVIRRKKPLAIYPLGKRWARRKRIKGWLRHRVHTAGGAAGPSVSGLRRAISDKAQWLGINYERDLENFHRQVVASGWASHFGEPLAPPKAPPPDDLGAVVARIRGLFGEGGAERGPRSIGDQADAMPPSPSSG